MAAFRMWSCLRGGALAGAYFADVLAALGAGGDHAACLLLALSSRSYRHPVTSDTPASAAAIATGNPSSRDAAYSASRLSLAALDAAPAGPADRAVRSAWVSGGGGPPGGQPAFRHRLSHVEHLPRAPWWPRAFPARGKSGRPQEEHVRVPDSVFFCDSRAGAWKLIMKLSPRWTAGRLCPRNAPGPATRARTADGAGNRPWSRRGTPPHPLAR
jgi:hypothetical protein